MAPPNARVAAFLGRAAFTVFHSVPGMVSLSVSLSEVISNFLNGSVVSVSCHIVGALLGGFLACVV